MHIKNLFARTYISKDISRQSWPFSNNFLHYCVVFIGSSISVDNGSEFESIKSNKYDGSNQLSTVPKTKAKRFLYCRASSGFSE